MDSVLCAWITANRVLKTPKFSGDTDRKKFVTLSVFFYPSLSPKEMPMTIDPKIPDSILVNAFLP